jgi:hypothetical protein
MRTLAICVTALLAVPAPIAARETAGATCDAKYYGDLVGQNLMEARRIGGLDYRVLPVGASRGVVNPKRITVTFDPDSNRIIAVDCG